VSALQNGTVPGILGAGWEVGGGFKRLHLNEHRLQREAGSVNQSGTCAMLPKHLVLLSCVASS
jgi:hypothetical protein